jgi:hypothetical protein
LERENSNSFQNSPRNDVFGEYFSYEDLQNFGIENESFRNILVPRLDIFNKNISLFYYKEK